VGQVCELEKRINRREEKMPGYTKLMLKGSHAFKGIQSSHFFEIFAKWMKCNHPGRKVSLSHNAFCRSIKPYCEKVRSGSTYYISSAWKDLDIQGEVAKHLEERAEEWSESSGTSDRVRQLRENLLKKIG
jgi:hypothetical protein